MVSNGNYFSVEFTIWLDAQRPERAHVTSKDDRFTDADGQRPGLRMVASANPLSADYNPAVYNRVVRAGQRAGGIEVPSGAHEITERPRHIDKRIGVVVDHLRARQRQQVAAPTSGDRTDEAWLTPPAASSMRLPWVSRLVDTVPDLRHGRAVLVAVTEEGAAAVALCDLGGAVVAWDGWYLNAELPPQTLAAAFDDEVDETWEVLTDLNRGHWPYAPFAWQLSEGVRVDDYARRMVQNHGDDARPDDRLSRAVPYAYAAV